MRVAVTAAGGGIGQSIIKSLKGTGYETVAIDPSPDAAGLYLADKKVLGSMVGSNGHIERTISICKKERCDFIFPGLDAELMPFAKNKDWFETEGTVAIISDPSVITLSDDKWELYKFLCANNLPRIESALSINEAKSKGIKLPWVLKPKEGGCRSKNVFECATEAAVQTVLDSGNEYIIQEFISGDEYTCGTVSFDGKMLGSIQMRRTLRNGDTYKAYVENNSVIESFLNSLIGLVKPFGPCNVQLRLRGGVPYTLEINARCSGTTAARTLAGFNEPLITCNHLNHIPTKIEKKEDIAIFRYWNEVVVDKETMETFKNESINYWG